MRYTVRCKDRLNLWLAIFGITAVLYNLPAQSEENREGKGLAILCAACHGVNGVSLNPDWPNIAGFSYESLVSILTEHRDGTLYHPFMLGAVEFLDDDAIKSISRYYSIVGKEAYNSADYQKMVSEQKPIHISLKPVTEDLYRFQYHITAVPVLVTSEGIVIVDAIIPEAAQWLKKEIKKRFNLPVRYLVYSHHHADHVAGATEFDDEAIIVAHEEAKTILIETNEINDKIAAEGKRITKYENTPLPDITFTGEMSISIGGKTINLFRPNPINHSDDLIVVEFVEDRTLFVADVVEVDAMGFLDFRRHDFPELIETLKYLEKIDFDYLHTGHHPISDKSKITEFRIYLEDLRDAVQESIDKGHSLEETIKFVSLEKHKNRRLYEQLVEFNISGAYNSLTKKSNN